ncbi:hypothetical protein K443DRAFT_14413 [Laccaria amethystina LaAM-08-1]|uniref:Uncharacterized protein n=1 Tax=Laccaria amethystina LaAM-08-1 TaxID=1095629 RepID=A0A0C9X4G9_9AGAR|nr:hypothetical protein K443DRAFT_14413 [Laccaria amethystina LaAM-08-1]
MPHITLDPSLEVRPDFTSTAYDTVCNALTTAEGITMKATAWEEQNRQDKINAAEARLAQEGFEQLKHEERRKEEEEEEKEKEKKKPKLKDFIANRPVTDTIQLHPSRYAIHKLDEQEYIELYYFTLEGCTEATKLDHTMSGPMDYDRTPTPPPSNHEPQCPTSTHHDQHPQARTDNNDPATHKQRPPSLEQPRDQHPRARADNNDPPTHEQRPLS